MKQERETEKEKDKREGNGRELESVNPSRGIPQQKNLMAQVVAKP